ncbi:hypothetical protein [Kyrpidia sp.]|uniref:hypothetical protein n=1 Tax=Kyrpidia sp. TaxID=2073077 RepID=UPI0025910D28|nr:hypothetical protein [Kyrpidia sp.]MCL6575033.1 hypothetical protein [Kyrpidia sp.]
MCGIVGYLDRTGAGGVVEVLFRMLQSLERRGPDAAGLAVFGDTSAHSGWKVRVLLSGPDLDRDEKTLREVVEAAVTVTSFRREGPYVVMDLAELPDLDALGAAVEDGFLRGRASLVYVGTEGDVWKAAGSVEGLRKFLTAKASSSHGIGHTRMATESREDLLNAQPFVAKKVPDLAVVHNGHITNHVEWKCRLERRGYRFTADSDSEVIPACLTEWIQQGATLEEALREAGRAFDGSFTILAADGRSVGFVRDRFATKPLVIAETEDFIAVANETVAVAPLLGRDAHVYEPSAGEVRVWFRSIAV